MKEDFDINKIGKQMPYQVPSGFFEEITSQTLAEAKRRSSSRKNFSFSSWKVLSVAASVAVLLLAGCLFFLGRQQVVSQTAQVKPVQVPTREPKEKQGPVSDSGVAEQPRFAVRPKPARSAIPAKVSTPKQVAKVAKPERTETLEELLANISDEELQQLAALAETEEYVYAETIE